MFKFKLITILTIFFFFIGLFHIHTYGQNKTYSFEDDNFTSENGYVGKCLVVKDSLKGLSLNTNDFDNQKSTSFNFWFNPTNDNGEVAELNFNTSTQYLNISIVKGELLVKSTYSISPQKWTVLPNQWYNINIEYIVTNDANTVKVEFDNEHFDIDVAKLSSITIGSGNNGSLNGYIDEVVIKTDSEKESEVSFENDIQQVISTNCPYLVIDLWDHDEKDGDVVDVYLNSENLLKKHKLKKRTQKERLKVELTQSQVNELKVVCQSTGELGTNTLSVQLVKGKVKSDVCILSIKKVGDTTTFIIIHDENLQTDFQKIDAEKYEKGIRYLPTQKLSSRISTFNYSINKNQSVKIRINESEKKLLNANGKKHDIMLKFSEGKYEIQILPLSGYNETNQLEFTFIERGAKSKTTTLDLNNQLTYIIPIEVDVNDDDIAVSFFSVKTDTIILEIWDDQVTDGDKVDIKVNGKSLGDSEDGFILTENSRRFEIKVSEVEETILSIVNKGGGTEDVITARIRLKDQAGKTLLKTDTKRVQVNGLNNEEQIIFNYTQ